MAQFCGHLVKVERANMLSFFLEEDFVVSKLEALHGYFLMKAVKVDVFYNFHHLAPQYNFRFS